MEPGDAKASVDKFVRALKLSGVITIVFAIALGILISPILFAIAVLAIVDFAIARAYASGVIGPLAARRRAQASGDAALIAESDPSYNPYARED
jgi:hypothetical protein